MKNLKRFNNFINEQASEPSSEIKKCKVSEEGIKNVSTEMIESTRIIIHGLDKARRPSLNNFPGKIEGKTITGEFSGVKYSWDLDGLETLKGRFSTDSQIQTTNPFEEVEEGYVETWRTESLVNLFKARGSDLPDAKPKSFCIGFRDEGGNKYMMAYPTKSGKCKVVYFTSYPLYEEIPSGGWKRYPKNDNE